MPIPQGEFSVGREDAAYVHVVDGSVSRKHAKVSNTPEGFYVEDLGSSNGTALRGVLITGRAKVDFGDIVHIGSVPFRVDPEVGGEPVVAPTSVNTGMRPVNRAYLSRDTERIKIPLVGETGPAESATIRPKSMPLPEPDPVPRIVEKPKPAPVAEITKEAAEEVTSATATTTMPRGLPFGKSAPTGPVSRGSATGISTGSKPGTVATAPPKKEDSAGGSGGSKSLVLFMAGLAVGLLLGLVIAMVFISMGGKH